LNSPNGTEPLGIALLPLDQLAPLGSNVSSIRVYDDSGNTDAGDGKIIIVGSDLTSFNICDADTDGDGVSDIFDLDSDNDGIYDVDEVGGTDANNDGIADGTPSATGIPASAGTGTTPIDTLSDGSFDFQNTDSDNDGCSDANEAYNDANADGGDGGQFGVGDPATVDPVNVLVTETVVDSTL